MQRRAFFKSMGATSTDHGHPSAVTANLEPGECETLFRGIERIEREKSGNVPRTDAYRNGKNEPRRWVGDANPSGILRNHNQTLFQRFGRDMGADIPTQTDYVHALQPLLNRFGNEPELSVILFTLDETSYSRELHPRRALPILKLGPPWWFLTARKACFDSAGNHRNRRLYIPLVLTTTPGHFFQFRHVMIWLAASTAGSRRTRV